MSPRFRLRNDTWDASAVLGNTEAHAYVAVGAASLVAEAAGMSIRQSLVGEAGIGFRGFGWLRLNSLSIYSLGMVTLKLRSDPKTI